MTKLLVMIERLKKWGCNVVTLAFIFALLIVLVLASGCGRAVPIDPPVFRYDIEMLTRLSAEAHARSVNGEVFKLANTGSMEPFLTGGDWLVVSRVPFNELKDGEIILYRAQWADKGLPPVCHRIAGRDRHGLIMSGDANKHSEARWRVNDADYAGKLIAVYRTNKDANR